MNIFFENVINVKKQLQVICHSNDIKEAKLVGYVQKVQQTDSSSTHFKAMDENENINVCMGLAEWQVPINISFL